MEIMTEVKFHRMMHAGLFIELWTYHSSGNRPHRCACI